MIKDMDAMEEQLSEAIEEIKQVYDQNSSRRLEEWELEEHFAMGEAIQHYENMLSKFRGAVRTFAQ